MFALFRRRSRWKVASRVRSRSEMVHATSGSLNGLAELAPELSVLALKYGQVQSGLFELLSSGLPEVEDPTKLMQYTDIAEEFRRRAAEALEGAEVSGEPPYGEAFLKGLRPPAWPQRILTGFLVSGILDDAALLLASTHRGLLRSRAEAVAASQGIDQQSVKLLSTCLTEDPELTDALSMWGRRLVGDSMLLARGLLELPEPVLKALHQSDDAPDPEVLGKVAVVETFRGELLTGHTQRMEQLGLAS